MNVITYLQDPELVAQFQYWFGVQRIPKLKTNYYAHISQSTLKRRKLREFDARNISSTENTTGKGWTDKIFGDGTVGGNEGSMEEESTLSESENEENSYVINNKFWFNLFYLATLTGDEIFYIVFFPFWAWNVDGAVLRRVFVIWMITMYIGQVLKDLLKVPRPKCPPVVRLDPKWGLEYGLPSTHAMVGFSIPFSIFILSLQRYQLDWTLCFVIASFWCVLVSASRIYLGMHSVLDVISGLILIAVLMALIMPLIDTIDHFTLTHPASPLISLMLTIAMIVCYPATDRWTPARGDTTVIVGVGCGSLVGSWLNFKTGVIREPSLLPPYTVIWPTVNMLGMGVFRTLLGLVLLVAVRAIFKSLSFATICALLQVSKTAYKNKSLNISRRRRLVVELFYKFITYIAIGFTLVYTAPLAFRIIGIERPTFYTEV